VENEDSNIHASERTNKALQQRADSMREQDALDAWALGHNTSSNLSQVLDNATTAQSLDVTANIQHQQVDSGGEPDKVQLSDNDDDETGNFLLRDSFAEKVGAYTGKGLAEALEKKTQTMQDDKSQRFSDRLAGKNIDDMPVLDRAINLVAAKKNLEGTDDDAFTILDSSNSTLTDISRLLGVDLGTSIDLISHNLHLIRAQEQARVNLFLQSREDIREVPAMNPEDTVLQPDAVNNILRELLALTEEISEDGVILGLDTAPPTGLMEEMDRRKQVVFPVKNPIRSALRGRKSKRKKC
jgi:hypothetical protein